MSDPVTVLCPECLTYYKTRSLRDGGLDPCPFAAADDHLAAAEEHHRARREAQEREMAERREAARLATLEAGDEGTSAGRARQRDQEV